LLARTRRVLAVLIRAPPATRAGSTAQQPPRPQAH
jgi:hypothetical protein